MHVCLRLGDVGGKAIIFGLFLFLLKILNLAASIDVPDCTGK